MPMIGQQGTVSAGTVRVLTANDRTFTPEEWADIAMPKLISIADTAPPEVQVQARAFADRIRSYLTHYFGMVSDERRARDVLLAERAGAIDAAAAIRSD